MAKKQMIALAFALAFNLTLTPTSHAQSQPEGPRIILGGIYIGEAQGEALPPFVVLPPETSESCMAKRTQNVRACIDQSTACITALGENSAICLEQYDACVRLANLTWTVCMSRLIANDSK